MGVGEGCNWMMGWSTESLWKLLKFFHFSVIFSVYVIIVLVFLSAGMIFKRKQTDKQTFHLTCIVVLSKFLSKRRGSYLQECAINQNPGSLYLVTETVLN